MAKDIKFDIDARNLMKAKPANRWPILGLLLGRFFLALGYVLAVIPFGVAYGSNLKQVTEVVEDAVNNLHHEWMDPEKKVKAVVAQMNDSSVDFNLFVWADAVRKSYVVSDVLKCVYDTLGIHGIEIPFPQRDIHIINNS